MDRTAKIATLLACQHNPIKDEEALKALTDDAFASLEKHCETQSAAFKDLDDRNKALDADLKAAKTATIESDSKLRAAEAKVRQLEKTPTEEEWLKLAPPKIKALIEAQQKADNEKKETLVGALKVAQSEYTEEELKAMEVSQLERLARMAKVADEGEKVEDFSASRQVPRAASQNDKNNVFLNPPDPYAEALKRQRESKTTH